MKVLVCGSRDWLSYDRVLGRLKRLEAPVHVIHGGARGADAFAEMAACVLGHSHQRFQAAWMTHGSAAGPIRNRRMLDQGPDLVIAFQRNGSRGTQDTIDEARRRGIPVEVHNA